MRQVVRLLIHWSQVRILHPEFFLFPYSNCQIVRESMKSSFLEIRFNIPKAKKPPKNPKGHVAWLIQKQAYLPFVKQHGLELLEIPEMVGVLVYHFNNFRRIEKKANALIAPILIPEVSGEIAISDRIYSQYSKASYEKASYLVALGKLVTTFTSDWCSLDSKTIVSTIPTMLALLPLRHKVDAHRSYDSPKLHEKNTLKANLPDAQLLYHIESHLLCNVIRKWIRKDGAINLIYEILINREDRHSHLKNNACTPINGVELLMDKGYQISFNLSQQHPIIIQEVINFIKNLLNCLDVR